jgi:hypothetical protein
VSAMRAAKATVYRCKCERCGHAWIAMKPPLRCAGCKSPYWDRKPKGGRPRNPRRKS